MSEYRQKLDGFAWPSTLPKYVKWLGRDRDDFKWFAFAHEPQIGPDGVFFTTHDILERVDINPKICTSEPVLLCRDDYETPAFPSGTEARVCEDIARRQQLGVSKYGVTVAENPLTHLQWLRHAYQECLDQAIYLRRAIETHEAVQLDQSKPSSP